jgi:hypothetical protein
MKRIIILSLLLPISLMAMEDQNPPAQTNEPLYVGIGTHLMSEGTYQGERVIFACEEDWIVYQENKEKNTFDYVDRITHNYVTRDEPGVIKTLPKELSSVEHNISNVSFTKSDVLSNVSFTKSDVLSVDLTSRLTGIDPARVEALSSISLPIGRALHIPITAIASIAATAKTKSLSLAAHFKKNSSQYCYAPETTFKMLKNIDPITKKIKEETLIINETKLSSSQITSLLKNPEPHPFSIVIAFLTLQKQNDVYTPVPDKNAIRLPDQKSFTINITQHPI